MSLFAVLLPAYGIDSRRFTMCFLDDALENVKQLVQKSLYSDEQYVTK